MQPKELHDFLFKLYDYADYLIAELTKGNCSDANVYIASLVYIEDMMDTYGRSLVSQSMITLGADQGESLAEAHRRIDHLRQDMMQLRKEYDFNNAIEQAEKRLSRNWAFTPEQHL
jgi:hypothetical protein